MLLAKTNEHRTTSRKATLMQTSMTIGGNLRHSTDDNRWKYLWASVEKCNVPSMLTVENKQISIHKILSAKHKVDVIEVFHFRCFIFRLISGIYTMLLYYTHREIFRNLIKSNRNQIVFTIFRLIWNQTDVLLVPDQSENGEYNLL